MKFIALLLILSVVVMGGVVKPFASITTDSAVCDMVARDGKLYVSTDEGKVHVFDLKSRKKLSTILLPEVKNANGTSFRPKIYSVDHCNGSTVMVSESGGEFRNVYINEKGKTYKVIDSTKGLLIKKVCFLDPSQILLGLSSDTLILVDLSKNVIVYRIQAGGGVFGDMALAPNKRYIAIGDESGEIAVIETQSGKKIKTLRGINLDAINRLSYEQNTLMSGGHDRRVGVYKARGSYFIETGFFVYAVALTPSASKGVYTDGEENELQVIDIETKKKVAKLQGGEVIIDHLLFMDERTLIGAGEENKIYYWRIP